MTMAAKKFLPVFLLALLLAPAIAHADYDAGLAAMQRQDFETAMKEFKVSAEHGDAKSQTNVGALYKNGKGVDRNYIEAMKWFRLAAAQGADLAQSNIGSMYYNGEGVPQDYAEAIKWYRLAAEQGDTRSQVNLGVMYRKGQGRHGTTGNRSSG